MSEKEDVTPRVNDGKMNLFIKIILSQEKVESACGLTIQEIGELLSLDQEGVEKGKYAIPCKVAVREKMVRARIVNAIKVKFSTGVTYDFLVYLEDDPDRIVFCVPQFAVFPGEEHN